MIPKVPPQRDSTRARDVDRTNARWLLEAAYAEGQLGAGEYHDRIAQAATADTLGELRNLTSDLQLPASVADTHPVGRRSNRGRLVAAAAVAAVVLAVGVAALTLLDREPDATPTSPASSVDVDATPDAPPDLTTPVDPFTESGIDAVVARYRHRFGDTTVTSLALYPDGVRVTRATAGVSGRVDAYELAEQFEPTGTEPTSPRTTAVDLARVDAAAVARLIAEAPTLVGAPAGSVEHVLVADSGRPTVTVYVLEGDRAVGYVVAGLDGGGAQAIRAN
ncbi:DUF1707 domain-containing protein [Rhodococcus sp. NPDC003318]|uniref:DUF1707 SHOCT-like domain-containing protein n=1 Tax=Rhodococcus sp. NPDC003318 TaxID=3364503 RepID=UPI0036CFE902